MIWPMIWTDKLALAVFVLATPFSWTLAEDNASPIGRVLLVNAMIAASAWLICRALDFLTGGPARRRAPK
jgi:hypothetical protein